MPPASDPSNPAPRVVKVQAQAYVPAVGPKLKWLLWVVLGFLFMPMTLLVYGLITHFQGGVEGWWLGGVVLAALFDLGLLGRLKPSSKDDD